VRAEHLALLGLVVVIAIAVLGPLTSASARRRVQAASSRSCWGPRPSSCRSSSSERQQPLRIGLASRADLVAVAFAFVAGPSREPARGKTMPLRSKGLHQPADAMRVAVAPRSGSPRCRPSSLQGSPLTSSPSRAD
jgi:hypothetical protein